MLRKIYLLGLAAVVPAAGVAQAGDDHYRCTNGDLVRRVQIVHETGAAVPCEVHYFKDTEAPGQREVLWRADNEAGYCEARTGELVANLESWGWRCAAAPGTSGEPAATESAAPESAAPAPESELPAPAGEAPRDDTDVLDAGDPRPQ